MSNHVNPSEVTIVTACKNREGNLSKVLPSWLSINPALILICDWGSSVPLSRESLGISSKNEDNITILRIDPPLAKSWILTWAFNSVLERVKTPFTLKLDCDHQISSNFLSKNPIQKWMFARGHSRYADRGQEYINGAFYSCTNLLQSVGFYDERITSYGWDDSDLYERLFESCCKSAVITSGSIFHIDQDEEDRTINQIVEKEAVLADELGITKEEFLITRNRIFCRMLWPWTREDFKNRLRVRDKYYNLEPDQLALFEHATLKAFDLYYKQKNVESKDGIIASEAYSSALHSAQIDNSCLPISIGIAQILKLYSDAVKADDYQLQGILRHLLIAKNLPRSLNNSRMNTLDQIDQVHVRLREI